MEKPPQNDVNELENLLGPDLLPCETCDSQNYEHTSTLVTQKLTVGIYFSFLNAPDDFLNDLVHFYRFINTARKRFEIVQVPLYKQITLNSDADYRAAIFGQCQALPWLTLPLDRVEKMTALIRKFNIKSSQKHTKLIILDENARTATTLGRERILSDPTGSAFPWHPRKATAILEATPLTKGGFWDIYHDNDLVDITQMKGSVNGGQPRGDCCVASKTLNCDTSVVYGSLPKHIRVRAFYFSANWCPPCRAFTPQLVHMYGEIRKRHGDIFEVVFVSSDRTPESFNTYLETMPWLAVPYDAEDIRKELTFLFGVQSIPTLVLLNVDDEIITENGRSEVINDPDALNFPWSPRLVNVLTERYATKLHDFPAVVLFIDGDESEMTFAENILLPVAEKYYQQHIATSASKTNVGVAEKLLSPTGASKPIAMFDFLLDEQDDDEHINCIEKTQCLQFLIGVDSDTADILREYIGLDDVVPLVTVLNLPQKKYAVMDGDITVGNVDQFVRSYLKGEVDMKVLKK